ncbi:MAG: hypothetical protein ACI4JN_05950, partial [Ruminococcus sp.]
MHHILRSSAAVLSCAIAFASMPFHAFADSECTSLQINNDGTYSKVYTVAESDITEEGWYTRDGGVTFSYYYEDGSFASGASVIEDGSTYIFTSDGTLKTGWQLAGGNRYYYSPENGQICLGWVDYMGKT